MGILRRLYLKLIKNIKIYYFCNIYPTAKIGKDCTIGSYSEIGQGVKIGDNCKIEAMVFIPKGVTIGNGVFLGPKTCFVNDLYPKAQGKWKVYNTIVEDGASIGANCTILCGIRIGKEAKIGAGSVVTRDVPDGQVVAGNPAKRLISAW